MLPNIWLKRDDVGGEGLQHGKWHLKGNETSNSRRARIDNDSESDPMRVFANEVERESVWKARKSLRGESRGTPRATQRERVVAKGSREPTWYTQKKPQSKSLETPRVTQRDRVAAKSVVRESL